MESSHRGHAGDEGGIMTPGELFDGLNLMLGGFLEMRTIREGKMIELTWTPSKTDPPDERWHMREVFAIDDLMLMQGRFSRGRIEFIASSWKDEYSKFLRDIAPPSPKLTSTDSR